MRHLLITFLLVWSNGIFACSEPEWPDLENLDKYSQIFIGEVTGVVLDGYQASRVHELSNSRKLPDFEKLNLGHQISAIITRTFKGEPEPTLKTQILGCGSEIPNPRMYGVFFREEESNEVIPLYEHQGKIYHDTIIELGRKYH